jgi:hypothetical protein
MAINQGQYQRSFVDALTLARNSRESETIYYAQHGVRAVYEVTAIHEGTLFINGRRLTTSDLPQDERDRNPDLRDSEDMTVRYSTAAARVFQHNGIDVTTGWDVRP